MKMRKSLIPIMLCLVLVFLLISTPASAATVASGSCGENLTWKLDNTGTLTISGTGAMTDYVFTEEIPWYEQMTNIEQFVFSAGITYIDTDIFFDNTVSGYWVDEANQHYSSDSCGVLFNKDKTTLIIAPGTMTGSYNVPGTVKTLEEGAFSGCELSEIILPDSLEIIGDSVFTNCDYLEELTIPYRVYAIGSNIFGGCDGLTGIWVHEDNLNFSNDSCGVLFNKDKTILLAVPPTFSGHYTVPETVRTIDAYAFSGCLWLTAVTVPTSVIRIEECAFFLCMRLTIINGCGGVQHVGQSAFGVCDALTDVYYGGTMSQASRIYIAPGNDPLLNATFHFKAAVPGDMDGDGDKDTDDAVYLLLNVMFGDEDYPLSQ